MPEGLAITLSGEVRRGIHEHVRREAPREAVGLIAGAEPGHITAFEDLKNVAGPLAFFADSYSQFKAEKRIKELGLTVFGYYHSHPGGGVELSADDRSFARRTDWVYLVVAAGWHGEPPYRIGGWRRSVDGEFTPVTVA